MVAHSPAKPRFDMQPSRAPSAQDTTPPDDVAIRAIETLPHHTRLRALFVGAATAMPLHQIAEELARDDLRLSHLVDWLTAGRRAGLIETVACEDRFEGRHGGRNGYRLSRRGRAEWPRPAAANGDGWRTPG
jgi:hypothetical protein